MAPKRFKMRLCEEEEEEEEEEETVDRLSDMPESLKVRILSLLDAKDAVRTLVLSKSWVSSWTGIPVFNFTSNGFDNFVLNALSRRQSLKLDKVTLEHDGECGDEISEKVFHYAFSHGVQELEAKVQYIKCWPTGSSDSLTRLELTSGNTAHCSFLEPRETVSFKNLTVLYLKGVTIKDVDPFSGFPALANLRLDFCLLTTEGNALNVHAPQLKIFVILYTYKQHVNRCEFTTPKLIYFECHGCNFPQLTGSFPILVAVVINYNGYCRKNQERMMFDDLLMLLTPLHNAGTLMLYSPVVHILTLFPLNGYSPPFPKLKILKLDFNSFSNPDLFQVPCRLLMELLELLPGLTDYLIPKSHHAKCILRMANSDHAQASMVLKSAYARERPVNIWLPKKPGAMLLFRFVVNFIHGCKIRRGARLIATPQSTELSSTPRLGRVLDESSPVGAELF